MKHNNTYLPQIQAYTGFSDAVLAGMTLRSSMQGEVVSAGNTKVFSASHARLVETAIAEWAGIQLEQFCSVLQVHETTVLKRLYGGRLPCPADGQITDKKGLLLGIRVADCCGVLLYDAVRHVVGAVHAGWRSTVDNIIHNSIDAMQHAYGTRAKDVQAYLSPCAGAEHYEVGEEVAMQFSSYPGAVKERENRIYLDIREVLSTQLQRREVSRIHVSKDCTITNTQYHSLRREKEESGRAMVFIMLR